MKRFLTLIVFASLLALSAFAQNAGFLRGQIADESGAVVPGAKVTATGPNGAVKSAVSGNDGAYSIAGLAPGAYTVRAESPGLTQGAPASVVISGHGVQALNIQLRVQAEKQEVTVQSTSAPALSTNPEENAGALVMRGEDLKALSDDPDELQDDLQALAGPAAGPDGGQIYIDGFTGGRMPPKSAIREIRINQNPFSSEYDKLGYGRIEILTKPGTDTWHGESYFQASDNIFNARNPFLNSDINAPFQMRHYGGSISGALNKKTSIFFDIDRREIDDQAVINATTLNPTTFAFTNYNQALATPARRTDFSPRVDYQINQNNTLSLRYSYWRNDIQNSGVGNFNLPSQGFNSFDTEQRIQATETAVLNSKTINETRFRYIHETMNQNALTSGLFINVAGSFGGGGSPIGTGFDGQNSYELQNYTTITAGVHTWKFGVRIRASTDSNTSPQNFNGTYTFSGDYAPILDANNQPVAPGVVCNAVAEAAGCEKISSIEQYRRTLLFQSQGLSADAIRALGGGASQFSIAAGNPYAYVNQVDLGFFGQDDWRIKPNVTLSLGLRYETQTNIHDWADFAPRVAVAWAPGQSQIGMRPKFVIRAGFGTFYSRFTDSYVLNAERYNGVTQQVYSAINPNFFPNVPPLSALGLQTSKITTIDPNLRAPYILQSAVSVERQLPLHTTLSITYTNSHGVHLLNSRDINSPIPGTYIPNDPNATGLRPFGDIGEIDQYESNGILNENHVFARFNSRVNANLSLFGGYGYTNALSDTDGAGTFPANQYNMRADYGPAAIDQHHFVFLAGSLNTKWNFRFSPFLIYHSSTPLDITTGTDQYGDTLFTGRPGIATDPNKPGVISTPYGLLDPNPAPGEAILPRNYGNGPSFFSLNLRVSKTFGFGPETEGGGGGGFQGGGPGGGGGHHHGGPFGDTSTSHRYNVTIGAQARNLLNTYNTAAPSGAITSPYFLIPNQLASGWGASQAYNRHIELQLRFMF